MPNFTCPNCKKVLKTATAIAAGKKVKCPACSQIFLMPAVEDKTAIQANKPSPPPRVPAPASASDGGAKRRRPDLDDDDEAPRLTSRKAKMRDEEDTDQPDEEEERPARRRKKKKAASNKNLILILGGAGALVLLLAVAAFLWPGFLVGGKTKVAGARAVGGVAAALDPLAFVPNNCDVVGGVNLAALRRQPGAIEQMEKGLILSNKFNAEQVVLFKKMDRLILAGNSAEPGGNLVVVFSSLAALDPAQVREAFNAGSPEVVEGKTFHRLKSGPTPGRDLLAIPDSKTIVVATMPSPAFVKLLAADGKLSSDMQAQVDTRSQKPLWAVVILPALMKDKSKQLDGMAQLPGGAQAMPALKTARTLCFSIDAPSDTRFQVDVQCANDKDAGLVEVFAKNLWEQQAKPALSALPLMFGKQPGGESIKMLIDDVNKNVQIQRQGSVVTASLTISEKTMNELDKFAANAAGANSAPTNVPQKKSKLKKK
jgi:phage FluMu protein Com